MERCVDGQQQVILISVDVVGCGEIGYCGGFGTHRAVSDGVGDDRAVGVVAIVEWIIGDSRIHVTRGLRDRVDN